MRTFSIVVVLIISAFLFMNISYAQDQQTSTSKSSSQSMQTDSTKKGKSTKHTRTSKKKSKSSKKADETGSMNQSGKQDETGGMNQSTQEKSSTMQSNRTGKVIFETNKCTTCHELKSEKIMKTGKSNAPDLSMVGADKDASWIEKFLKKNESLNGKKHPIAFKGTDDELKTLATWLAEHGGKNK